METKQITPWCWARFEWLSIVQLFKKFVALYRKKPKVHYRVNKSPTLDYIQSQIHPVHPYYSPKILHTHLRLCLPSGLFPSGFSISNLHAIARLPHSCSMHFQFHSPWLEHSNSSYKVPHYASYSNLLSIHLPVQISSSAPCSQTLSPWTSLNVTEQVSHSYKTTRTIIVLPLLIFTFLDSRQEGILFRTQWEKQCPN
jgi:hypothetical protein